MKRLIIVAAICVAAFCGCQERVTPHMATVEGRFVGGVVDSLFLERISDTFDSSEVVARAALADDGGFCFNFEVEEDASPRFYSLSFGGEHRPVVIVVAPGDKIYLEAAGDIFLNYEVRGSRESELIRLFTRDYFNAGDRLSNIANNIERKDNRLSDMEMRAYQAAKDAIQTQLRFVGSNPGTLAAFYAMHHRVAERYIPQLEGYGIGLAHYRSVLEGIRASYPTSPYITLLERSVAEQVTLAEITSKVTMVNYPDIELEDIYKKSYRLSSLDGKVVLLYFWSATNALCNTMNADLKAIYDKYHDRGFEIYHVSSDSDISMWIEAVRQQKHPWISVFGGHNPEVFATYNVGTLPMAYIISRDGDMNMCPMGIERIEAEIVKRL